MRTKELIGKENDEIKGLSEKIKHLQNQIDELKQPVLVDVFDSINVKPQPYSRVVGMAKVIKTYFNDYWNGYYNDWVRYYELLITTKSGESLQTVTQDEFKRAIERAEK